LCSTPPTAMHGHLDPPSGKVVKFGVSVVPRVSTAIRSRESKACKVLRLWARQICVTFQRKRHQYSGTR